MNLKIYFLSASFLSLAGIGYVQTQLNQVSTVGKIGVGTTSPTAELESEFEESTCHHYLSVFVKA